MIKKITILAALVLVHFSVLASVEPDTLPEKEFKRTYQFGTAIHMFGALSGGKTTAAQDADPSFSNKMEHSFNIYRARLMFGAQLSKKGNVFIETEIPTIIGTGAGTKKNMQVGLIILDAQYEHVFARQFSVIAGKMLVSHNRNGLQGVATLMGNDFTHYQYPYNMTENDPLQGNFGRDVGVNTRGFFLKDKLEYRLGVFTGRKFDGKGPVRVVSRVAYNFLDNEKDLYYAGTKLGEGRTFALAGGLDMQGSYKNVGMDAFLDLPAGRLGSITINGAFTHMTGGTGTGEYSFSRLIPRQNIQFLEVGYYFKKLKLQPWFKYENQQIDAKAVQFGLPVSAGSHELSDLNTLNSNRRIGGGINYFFNGINTNVRASYTNVMYGRNALHSGTEKASYNQFWLQVQLFVF